MKLYIADGDWLCQEYDLITGARIRFRASDIRKERTGVHARIDILLNDFVLAWTAGNVDRDEDRVRLANSAYRHLTEHGGEIDRNIWSQSHMKHALDSFCGGLWKESVKGLSGEMMEGDLEVGPPSRIAGPYILRGAGTILYAPPGRGKSISALALGVSVDADVDTIWPICQAKVLYINLERSKASMQHRLARMNQALGLPPARPLTFLNARGRSLAEVNDAIRNTIRKFGVEVIFLDSISRAGLGDLKEGLPANRVIDQLNALSDTWLAIAHTPRGGGGGSEEHIYGSVFFEAGMDVGVRLLSQSTDGVTGIGFQITKANDLPKIPLMVFALEWNQTGLTAIRPAKSSEFPEITGATITVADLINEHLADVGQASASEIAHAIDRDPAHISRLLATDARYTAIRREGRKVTYGRIAKT